MDGFEVKKKDLKNFSEVNAGINISKTIYETSSKTNRVSGRQKKLNLDAIPVDIAKNISKLQDLEGYFEKEAFKEITEKDMERLKLFADYVEKDRRIRVSADPEAVSRKIKELLAMLPEDQRKAAMGSFGDNNNKK
jgi:hypothetical protein